MATVYLRNVPDEVVDKLHRLAAGAGMSLNAFAARELRAVAQRADNAALMAALPSLDIGASDIVDVLAESRRAR